MWFLKVNVRYIIAFFGCLTFEGNLIAASAPRRACHVFHNEMELKRHSADEAMFMVIENHEVVVLALPFTDKSALKRRTAVIPSNED